MIALVFVFRNVRINSAFLFQYVNMDFRSEDLELIKTERNFSDDSHSSTPHTRGQDLWARVCLVFCLSKQQD